jgi:hypothetical protein
MTVYDNEPPSEPLHIYVKWLLFNGVRTRKRWSRFPLLILGARLQVWGKKLIYQRKSGRQVKPLNLKPYTLNPKP